MPDKRDYYEVLGVARSASPEEIRKAYKTLAKKYHPDFNPNDKAAESSFKEVSEAYAVLSNEDARKKYDAFGHQKPGAGGFDFSGFDFRNMSGGFRMGGDTFFGSFGDILGEIFGGRGRRRGGEPRGPQGDPFAGFGFGGFENQREAPEMRYQLSIDFLLAAQGGVKKIKLPGRRQAVSVRIPAGINTGQTIRLRSDDGDILIELTVESHSFFTRDGLNLHCQVPISIGEAVLGAKVPVPTLDGEATITVPPGTQGGQTFRLRGRGIRKNDSEKGDIYVKVQIAVPKKISDKAKVLIQNFEKETPLHLRVKR